MCVLGGSFGVVRRSLSKRVWSTGGSFAFVDSKSLEDGRIDCVGKCWMLDAVNVVVRMALHSLRMKSEYEC